MVDIVVKVLEPAENYGLMTVEEMKILLGMSAADTTMDAQLQMLIDQNSAWIGTTTNRKNFAREKVEETWRCVAVECCPDGATKLYLLKWPVKAEDIESVESPRGYPVDPAYYEVDEDTGKLLIFASISSEVVVTYTGGYVLPDEAPDDLKMALGVLVREQRNSISRDTTVGSGVRMISHKDSRVMFYSPKDIAAAATQTGGGASSSAQQAAKSLISHYTHYWM